MSTRSILSLAVFLALIAAGTVAFATSDTAENVSGEPAIPPAIEVDEAPELSAQQVSLGQADRKRVLSQTNTDNPDHIPARDLNKKYKKIFDKVNGWLVFKHMKPIPEDYAIRSDELQILEDAVAQAFERRQAAQDAWSNVASKPINRIMLDIDKSLKLGIPVNHPLESESNKPVGMYIYTGVYIPPFQSNAYRTIFRATSEENRAVARASSQAREDLYRVFDTTVRNLFTPR